MTVAERVAEPVSRCWENSEFEEMGGRARRRETKRIIEFWDRRCLLWDLIWLLEKVAMIRGDAENT